jgi:AraC-like DNA-binding protein
MRPDEPFRRINVTALKRALGSDGAIALARAVEIINRHFREVTGLELVTTGVDDGLWQEALPWREHPLCTERCTPASCRQKWLIHLQELQTTGAAHWHCCDCGMYCAVAPIRIDGRCVAASRLVCDGNLPERSVVHYLELLTVMTELLSASRQTAVQRHETPTRAVEPGPELRPTTQSQLVQKAIDHIERHLTDRNLSVAGVGQALDVNATYIAHVFSRVMGEHMSRYIARRRVDLALHLLATTDWSIKRVAFACGFSGASWFGQSFRQHTQMTPSEYRELQRRG